MRRVTDARWLLGCMMFHSVRPTTTEPCDYLLYSDSFGTHILRRL